MATYEHINKNGNKVLVDSAIRDGDGLKISSGYVKKSDIVDSLDSTQTQQPLSAKQGKVLNDRLNNISSIGRFLALWDCTTGLPLTNPSGYPYTYHTGDYFRVSKIGTTNYVPTGSSYQGVPSTQVYTGDIAVGDIFFYDGTTWYLQFNRAGGGDVQDVQINGDSIVESGVANILVDQTYSSTSENAQSGIAVASAVSGKQDTITNSNKLSSSLISGLSAVATSGDYEDLNNTPTIPTVNNSTISFTQGGVSKGSFTLNQDTGTTIDFDTGGGGEVDQTFDPTSANAQSGTAVAGAISGIDISGKVNKSGDTMTGDLLLNGITSAVGSSKKIYFGASKTTGARAYISANTNGTLAFGSIKSDGTEKMAVWDANDKAFRPAASGLDCSLGTSSQQWDSVRAKNIYKNGVSVATVNDIPDVSGKLDKGATNATSATTVINSTVPAIFTLNRTSSGGGAFIDYAGNNQTTKYWRVGCGGGLDYEIHSGNSGTNTKIFSIKDTGVATFTARPTVNGSNIALSSEIPDVSGKANLSGGNTFSGLQTVNAPTNIASTEQTTMKVKTSNDGAIVLGKEGANSGTMIRLDQTDGTCRLRFRASATAGAMVWEQPENGARLYFDMMGSNGVNNRIALPANKAGTVAMTSDIGNGTVTITQGGTSKGSFTLNQTGNATIALDAGSSGLSVSTATTTKLYVLGTTATSGSITGAKVDTGVYLDTTAGRLTATTFNATSDKRLKKNITEYKPEKSILDLPVYEFDYIKNDAHTIGCLAQDLQEICPQIVNEDEDGYLSIQESKLVYLLLDEVKKLKEEIKELKGGK